MIVGRAPAMTQQAPSIDETCLLNSGGIGVRKFGFIMNRSSASHIIQVCGLAVALGHGSIAFCAPPAPAIPDDPEGKAMLLKARQQISSYHSGHPSARPVLRVVYFVPSDCAPLNDHAARLDRVMKDVRGFYQEEFRRFGLDDDVLPLEERDGKLVIHEVKGKSPAKEYHHMSGDVTGAEVRAALKGTIDFEREHVLVLYALCRKEPDGRYVFDAPYYGEGGSNQRRGFCHAADCELLDPLLLKRDPGRTIVYTEHYYPRMEQTVAAFNSMYLGGIAHEMGHGIGLPHDAGNPAESGFGESLMGGGNLTYRRNVWGGSPSSYLSRATALQLLSQPLFTRSDKGRWEDAGGFFKSLSFADDGGSLEIQGEATGKIPPYAVIARVWPVSARTDHGAVSYPVVLDGGSFRLKIPSGRMASNWLTLTLLHANGETFPERFEWRVDVSGRSNLTILNSEWLVDRAEVAVVKGDPRAKEFVSDEVLAAASDPDAAGKLRVLRALLEPGPPLKLEAMTEDTAHLSDSEWMEAKVGWGGVTRNSFWFDKENPGSPFLSIMGKFHDKGLYAHTPASHVFDLGGKWKTFKATVGLQYGAGKQGSAIFIVKGDGKVLCKSAVLRDGAGQLLGADVSGVRLLELETQGGESHNHRSWAVWGDPRITR